MIVGTYVYCEHCRHTVAIDLAVKTASWYRCPETWACICVAPLVCGCARIAAPARDGLTPAPRQV